MAFTFKGTGSASTTNSTTANQASYVLTTVTTAGSVGDLAVITYAIDNNQTTDGDEGAVTGIVDSAGNTGWTKAVEFTNGQGGAQAGATCGIWYCNLTAALAIGATITLSFSNATSRDASATNLTYFTMAAGSTASVEGTPTTLAYDAANVGSQDCTTSNIECVRIRAFATESNSGIAMTKTAAFTGLLTMAVASNAPSATGMIIRGEYAISTGTALASAPTYSNTEDKASVYAAFKEVVAATGPWNSWNNSTDVGGQVAVIARKAAAALLIAASAPSSVPFNTVQPARAANYTNFGWYNPLSPAPKVAKARQGDSFVPFNTAQVVSTATYGWQAPLSVAVRIGGPQNTQPAFVVPPFVVPQGWQAPLSSAPNPPNAQSGLVTGPFGPTPAVTLAWQPPLSVALPPAKAQAGNSFVPYNTAQLSVNFTNLGWHGPTATAAPVARAQAGFSFVPFDTRQLSVNFTNFGWHGPTSTAAPVARAQQGNSFVPYNTAQVAAAVAATAIGVPLTMGSAPPFARVVYAQTTFQPPYVAPAAATATGIPLTMGNAPAAARLVYAQTRFEVPYLPETVVGATGIPLTTGNAPPSVRVVYAQTKFDVLYVAPATPALNYTNFGWYAPLATPVPVAKAQAGYSFVPFNTAQVPAEIGIPLDFGGAAPRYRTVYYQSRFFPPYPTAVVVAAAPNGWQPPLSTPLPLPKAQAGYSSVPYNTAQLAVNYQNFGWYAPLAGAPLVAKAQPGSSFVPYNTAQLIVNYTNFGWYQPLSVPAPVAKAQVGYSFVPYNTAQLSVNFTNFGWHPPPPPAPPVARARQGDAFVPYNTAQAQPAGIAGMAWFNPLGTVPARLLAAPPGNSFVPFDTVQVIPPVVTPPVETPPDVLGGTTSVGGGGGGFCRKTWKKCLEEIRQQLADEQASLKAAKARHEEIDYAARAARIAKIQASAAALEADCAAESLAVASARIERFIDRVTKIEADYQAALLRQEEEDEDDVLTILLT